MKACITILVIVVISAPPLTPAQARTSNDLDTMLRDASYVFNRFEEVSAGVRAEIDASYPAGIRNNSKEALTGVLEYVEIEKPKLNTLLGHRFRR